MVAVLLSLDNECTVRTNLHFSKMWTENGLHSSEPQILWEDKGPRNGATLRHSPELLLLQHLRWFNPRTSHGRYG